jgi:hypothetical protein
MVSPPDRRFVHRANRDGSTDSICKDCFATVCTSAWETELGHAERTHVCDPSLVARFRKIAGRVDGEGQDSETGKRRT